MITIIVGSTIIALLVGLFVKLFLDYEKTLEFHQNWTRITWPEFAITGAIIALLIAPLVSWGGWKLSLLNQTRYTEYVNGFETNAVWTKITCYRDGPCAWSYECDPYTVCHEVCSTDSEGHEDCHEECHTEYHECPYCDQEWNFDVATTIGNYAISHNRFPDNPNSHRWRSSEWVPSGVAAEAGVGVPRRWAETRARLDSLRPGAATRTETYDNFILASDHTILKEYSAATKQLADSGMLPTFQRTIWDFYKADKVYFVGIEPTNRAAWQDRLMSLNGALGYLDSGDVHLVFIKSSLVTNSEDYLLALKSFWQNALIQKSKFTLGKNSILVIVGIKDSSVAWAKALTGMPMGNELMIARINDELRYHRFTPDSIIGTVIPHFEHGVMRYDIHDGLAGIIVQGNSHFDRVAMAKYLYLKGEIVPSASAQTWLFIIVTLLCLAMWIIPIEKELHAYDY